MIGKAQLLSSAAHKWRASSCSGTAFCTLPYGNPSSVLAVRQPLSYETLGSDLDVLWCCEITVVCLNKQTLCPLEAQGLLVLFSPCQHHIPIFCQRFHVPYLPEKAGEITAGLPTADRRELPWEKRTCSRLENLWKVSIHRVGMVHRKLAGSFQRFR